MSVVSRVFHKNVSKMSATGRMCKLYVSNFLFAGRTRSRGCIRYQRMRPRVKWKTKRATRDTGTKRCALVPPNHVSLHVTSLHISNDTFSQGCLGKVTNWLQFESFTLVFLGMAMAGIQVNPFVIMQTFRRNNFEKKKYIH